MQTFPQSHFWMCLDKYQKIALLVVIIWEKHTAKCIVIDCFVGIYDQPNDSLKDPKAPRGIEIALALCRRSIACTSYHHRKKRLNWSNSQFPKSFLAQYIGVFMRSVIHEGLKVFMCYFLGATFLKHIFTPEALQKAYPQKMTHGGPHLHWISASRGA